MASLGSALKKLKRDVNRAAFEANRSAAVQIVNDLKREGPYWDGLFEMAWEVRVGYGELPIPADQKGFDQQERSATANTPSRTYISLDDVPSRVKFTDTQTPDIAIGNRMEYRDIALDLVPGRWRGGMPPNTAPQDWYTTYVQGGELQKALGDGFRERFKLPGSK